MARENTDTEEKKEEAEETPRKKRKGLFLGSGILILVATGYVLSLVAIPTKGIVRFAGPFVTALSPEDLQVNLSGDGGKRFLILTLQAEYDAYQQIYAQQRVAEPLYQAKLKDVLIRLSRKNSKEDLDDPVGEEVFKGEVQEAIDPLLFPVHVGNEKDPNAGHESGLRPGRSAGKSTLRDGYWSHRIHVDAPRGRIQLDEGPVVEFEGHETDLKLENEDERYVHVDVSRLDPEFVGDVHAGTFGRVRNIYFGKFLVQ